MIQASIKIEKTGEGLVAADSKLLLESWCEELFYKRASGVPNLILRNLFITFELIRYLLKL